MTEPKEYHLFQAIPARRGDLPLGAMPFWIQCIPGTGRSVMITRGPSRS